MRRILICWTLILLALNQQTPVWAEGSVSAAQSTVQSRAQSTPERQSVLSQFHHQQPEFLKVDQAFQLTTELSSDGSLVTAQFVIADDYYLYRDRFLFKVDPEGAAQLGTAQLPEGEHKQDEYFGDVVVYHHNVVVGVPIEKVNVAGARLGITYQGCAEAGLCYPPETKWIALDNGAGAGTAGVTPGPTVSTIGPAELQEEDAFAKALGGSLLAALGLFFVAGVGLAFTPCVLPMVPILSSIIVGQGGEITRMRALMLSLAYVVPMALTYALLGVLVGTFGAEMNLQAAMQSPPVLIFFALMFAVLSLAMFGFYELQLPSSWQERLNAISQKQQGGTFVGAAIMGALSALVVSPCVSAPLVGALIGIAQQGAVVGGMALLALGLGMGLPLVLVGTLGGQVLPRAGVWMNAVKAVFGVLLLGVSVWLLERVLPGPVSLLLWASLLIGSALYLGALDLHTPRQGPQRLTQGLGVLMLVWGVLMSVGAASGASDPLAPLGKLTARAHASEGVAAEAEFVTVVSNSDFQSQLSAARSAGKPLLLDFYADWCISCKVMERQVFPVDEVRAQMSRFHLVRADVTSNNELVKAHELFGPPSILLFDATGIERMRIQGERDAAALSRELATFFDSAG